MATARETYRERVRLGFDGETGSLPFDELTPILAAFRAKVRAGIQRAVEMNDGIPPTYFAYTVTDYERSLRDGSRARRAGSPLRPGQTASSRRCCPCSSKARSTP